MNSRFVKRLISLFAALFCMAAQSFADEAAVRAALEKFAEDNGYQSIESGIEALGATGDPAAALSLKALSEGRLVLSKADAKIYVLDASGTKRLDPVTGAPSGEAAAAPVEKLKIKNSIRRKIAAALSGMTLLSKDRNVRLQRSADHICKR